MAAMPVITTPGHMPFYPQQRFLRGIQGATALPPPPPHPPATTPLPAGRSSITGVPEGPLLASRTPVKTVRTQQDVAGLAGAGQTELKYGNSEGLGQKHPWVIEVQKTFIHYNYLSPTSPTRKAVMNNSEPRDFKPPRYQVMCSPEPARTPAAMHAVATPSTVGSVAMKTAVADGPAVGVLDTIPWDSLPQTQPCHLLGPSYGSMPQAAGMAAWHQGPAAPTVMQLKLEDFLPSPGSFGNVGHIGGAPVASAPVLLRVADFLSPAPPPAVTAAPACLVQPTVEPVARRLSF